MQQRVLLSAVLSTITSLSFATAVEQPSSEKALRAYYAANLPEAKTMMMACRAKGFDKVQGDERIRCRIARNAWHFQPYVPSKKK